MELRLGELLLRDRLITNTQLEEALESQAGRGIKLGSALFELGYVEENALGRALSAKLGVPFVGRSELSSIPGEVIRDFSRSMAVKYNVMPFKLERKRLGLAMSDPNDFRALEDIAFMTGRVVQPYIAPDVHISDAQARYYRISGGESRYRMLVRGKPRRYSVHGGKVDTREKLGLNGEGGEQEYEDYSSLNAVFADKPATTPVLERFTGKLAQARTVDEVGNLLIEYVAQALGTGALFQLRGGAAVGWRGVSNGRMIDSSDMGGLILGESSVVCDVAASGRFSLGHLIDTSENRRILGLLGLSGDTPLFVLPLVLRDRTVAVLMVSAETCDPGGGMEELRGLANDAVQALAMLILRKRGVSR